MENYIKNFIGHLEEAVQIGSSAVFKQPSFGIKNVCITGLGGSGIGGTIVSDLVRKECAVPVLSNKGYFLPGYIDKHSLVIVSSYSGNTEETLNALEMAENAGAQIACITSGGRLQDIAKEKGYNHVLIPGGFPPRAAFGYSSLQSLFILQKYGLISSGFVEEFEATISLLKKHQPSMMEVKCFVGIMLFLR